MSSAKPDIRPIDDIDGRMQRQHSRLLAGDTNDLAACHDHVVNHFAGGKHERDPLGSHTHLGKRVDFGPQPLRKDAAFGGVQKLAQTGSEVGQLQANIRALGAGRWGPG